MTAPTARIELLRWTAGLGAVTSEALARRHRVSVGSARATLGAAVRAGQLRRHRPLTDGPALYTITRSGVRAAGLAGIEPCRVSPTSARHMTTCAFVAACLERRYPGRTLVGECELRKREREAGAPLAGAVLRHGGAHRALVHRPDLVLLAHAGSRERPVAVEVELTVKAPRRLAEICRAWARSRHVDGVLYIAPPAVERALIRAIDVAQASVRVVVVPLDSLGCEARAGEGPAWNERSIPSIS
jgi:hypothetical protein